MPSHLGLERDAFLKISCDIDYGSGKSKARVKSFPNKRSHVRVGVTRMYPFGAAANQGIFERGP
jgi:hypothetical protein